MKRIELSPSDYLKTLEQLENDRWGILDDASHLITTCHRLRQIPLKELSIENLRIMIGQNISLDILIPMAIAELGKNILAEGDFYPGDLLENVLRSDPSFWKQNPKVWRSMRDLFLEKNSLPEGEVISNKTQNLFAEFEKLGK